MSRGKTKGQAAAGALSGTNFKVVYKKDFYSLEERSTRAVQSDERAS
jgi:hypothetical protein